MQLKQNTQKRAVSVNRVTRDVSFVKNVSARVQHLLGQGHDIFHTVGEKKSIRHIIEAEFGICRQAVYMAFRALDLMSAHDKMYLKNRENLKKDLARYGIGLENEDAVGTLELSRTGIMQELCDKYGVTMTTMCSWVAALNFAAELKKDKNKIKKTVERKSPKTKNVSVLDTLPDNGDESDATVVKPKRRYTKKNKNDNATNGKSPAVVPVAEEPVQVTPRVKRKYTRRTPKPSDDKAPTTAPLDQAVAVGGSTQATRSLISFNISISEITAGFRTGDYRLCVESKDSAGNESTCVKIMTGAEFTVIGPNVGVNAIITALVGK